MTNQDSITYQEIVSQPDVWRESLNQLIATDVSSWPDYSISDQMIIFGCGSTYYLSIWGSRAIQKSKMLLCRPLPSSELLGVNQHWYLVNKRNLLLAISRSGTTSETVAVLKNNASKGNDAFGITCYPESDLPKFTSSFIGLNYAQEKSIAQTRSFTNMMLGLAYFVERDVPQSVPEKLSSQMRELFDQKGEMITALANDLSLERMFFLGSGQRYGIACEAMLKMKEMSLSYSEAYHFMEFRHGPMSMINERSLVIGLLGRENPSLEIDVLNDMKALGAKILAIGKEEFLQQNDWIDYSIPIDFDGLGIYGDVLYLPLLQLLAYYRAKIKGLEPDNPTNLSYVVKVSI